MTTKQDQESIEESRRQVADKILRDRIKDGFECGGYLADESGWVVHGDWFSKTLFFLPSEGAPGPTVKGHLEVIFIPGSADPASVSDYANWR